MFKDIKNKLKGSSTPSHSKPPSIASRSEPDTNSHQSSNQHTTSSNNSNNNNDASSRPLSSAETSMHSVVSLQSPSLASSSDSSGQGRIRRRNFSSSSSVASSMPPTPTFDHRRIQSFGSLFTAGSDQLLDHSHLKPGQNAELLAYNKTLNMYRENAKRTNDVYIQTEFAAFLVEASQGIEDTEEAWSYLVEAQKILKQLSLRGHGDAQYYLANLYALGILHRSHKSQFDKAFPLFVQAAKHHHADAAYRVGKCYEDGLGTRKDKSKAVQYYKKAATLNHPGAMYRLGLAEIHGELGMAENLRDGHKWLKRSAEIANAEYPHALHELAMLHEKGNAVIFIDEAYAHSLYTDAAELGYAPSAYRLGECYEFGHLKLKPDPAMSIYYYTIAADQDHPQACYALAAWYLVGHGTVLEPSEDQAYYWAHRAATKGYKRAEYAVGHFCEVGIGRDKDMEAATSWYQKAADHGDQRAVQRLKELATEGLAVRPAPRRTTNSMLWNRKK